MPLSYFCMHVRARFIADSGAIIVPLGSNDRVGDFTTDIPFEPLTHLGGSEDDLLAKGCNEPALFLQAITFQYPGELVNKCYGGYSRILQSGNQCAGNRSVDKSMGCSPCGETVEKSHNVRRWSCLDVYGMHRAMLCKTSRQDPVA